MNGRDKTGPHEIYPAYTFSAAPTFNKWVHLTAADVQGLRQVDVFVGQNIYFHLNHPIEYVYVTGPVVAIDHISTQYSKRFTILEIDDGSGATVEAKISYYVPRESAQTHTNTTSGHQTIKRVNKSREFDDDCSDSQDSGSDSADQQPTNPHHKLDDDSKSHQPLLKTHVFETSAENVCVVSGPSGTDVFLHDSKKGGPSKPQRIDVGTVLKAKGTLQRWRESNQLVLRSASLVGSLDEEVQFWTKYSDFATQVLSKPWYLSKEQVRELEQKRLLDIEEQQRWQARRRERERAKKAKRLAWEAKRERLEQKVERKLARQAEIDGLDGNPLDRPDWKPIVSLPPPSPPPVRETAPRTGPVMTTVVSGFSDAPWQHECDAWQQELSRLQSTSDW